jgi:hypothetical protein
MGGEDELVLAPDRMIAGQLTLCIGFAIIIAITLCQHWKAAHP